MTRRERDTFDMFQPRDRGRFGDNETVRSNADVKSDLIDLVVTLHHETPAKGQFNQGAVLVSLDGDKTKAAWIPKSLCEVEKGEGRSVTVTLSRAFAKEKGLI